MHSFEEGSRDFLITRILQWARLEDADQVHEEVRELAVVLEKYIAVDIA